MSESLDGADPGTPTEASAKSLPVRPKQSPPEPANTEPAAPEPAVADPTTPEPTTPELTTPELTVPEPTSPFLATPELTVPPAADPLAPPPELPLAVAEPVPMTAPPPIAPITPSARPVQAALVQRAPATTAPATPEAPGQDAAAEPTNAPPPPSPAAVTSTAPPPPAALDAILSVEPNLESIAGGASALPTHGPMSPYLVLGLAYGADLKAARAAFVAATKRLAEFASPPFRLDDLTWALHQIEHNDSETFELRIPADPELGRRADEPGLFGATPVPMERATEQVSEHMRNHYLQRALHQCALALAVDPAAIADAPPVYVVKA